MPSGSSALSASWLLAFAFASSGCVVARPSEIGGPAIPSVASIPVAPLGTSPSLSPEAPAPVVGLGVASSAPPPPAVETSAPPENPPAPVAPAPPPKPLVVLVDELPYRWAHLVAKDPPESEHASRAKRGRRGRLYHPAPGIVVEADEVKGGIAAAEVQRAARAAGYWPFLRCYEEGLRRDQGLFGKVSLHLAIAAGGAVERAKVESATLRDESVALCIGREASHFAFSPTESPTNAKVDVSLSTGDEPVIVPRPALHADELREALRASWAAVEQCYASELQQRPNAGGRLELRFRARSNGEIVEVAEEGETRFGDVEVTRCVLGVYRAARLPASRVCSARETSFGYAIHLESRR
jgi:hypothetical protein